VANTNADLLFGYLRDIIYQPTTASLDVSQLEADFRSLGEAVIYFAQCIDELRTFASALSKGELKTPPPAPGNLLASSLKALQSSLRHLTWQSQQVAKGDYQQRVDFMGDFADAFNTMTTQLATRQRSLELEIESNRAKNQALEQSNALLASITANAPQSIIVISEADDSILYQNNSADALLAVEPQLVARLLRLDIGDMTNTALYDLSLTLAEEPHYFSAASYILNWQGQGAIAFVLNDISDDIAHLKQLEIHAYYDNLTLLYNRYYGMRLFQQWLDEGREFVLCFLDLDNLKYVNDTFGHSEGDTYIKKTANLLKNFAAESVACRLGGDEFMLLAPNLNFAQATERVDEIRVALVNANREKPYYSNISYGIVEIAADNTLPASDLLTLADDYMYAYKRANKQANKQVNNPKIYARR
jgi:diguanylate cyclase (GGDEF)-like protein